MKLEVNLSKKYFFILLGAILLLAGAIYGFAYGGSEPEVMGHSGGEIEVTINGETKLLNEALENLANSSLAFPYNCSPHDLGGTGGPTGNEHFKSLSRGVIDTRDLVYFFSVTIFFLFITKIRLENE